MQFEVTVSKTWYIIFFTTARYFGWIRWTVITLFSRVTYDSWLCRCTEIWIKCSEAAIKDKHIKTNSLTV